MQQTVPLEYAVNSFISVGKKTVNKTETNIAAQTNAPDMDAPTILVVDDELFLLEIASTHLELMGYQILMADGPKAALKILGGDTDIDLLFSDVRMPGNIDGFELAILAKALRPDIKIVLTSAYHLRNVDMPAFNKAGAALDPEHSAAQCEPQNEPQSAEEYVARISQDILHKPYSADDLAQKIRLTLHDECLDTSPKS